MTSPIEKTNPRGSQVPEKQIDGFIEKNGKILLQAWGKPIRSQADQEQFSDWCRQQAIDYYSGALPVDPQPHGPGTHLDLRRFADRDLIMHTHLPLLSDAVSLYLQEVDTPPKRYVILGQTLPSEQDDTHAVAKVLDQVHPLHIVDSLYPGALTLRSILASACFSNSPADVQIAVLTPNPQFFRGFNNEIHNLAVANSTQPNDIKHLLSKVKEILDNHLHTHIVLGIDMPERWLPKMEEKIQKNVRGLIAEGQSLHVWPITTITPDAYAQMPDEFRNNFLGTRLIGKYEYPEDIIPPPFCRQFGETVYSHPPGQYVVFGRNRPDQQIVSVVMQRPRIG